jgi:hypothetical protein
VDGRIERLQLFLLDPVLTLDLLDDQLRVADQLELGRTLLSGKLDAADQRRVLGLVVGGGADALGVLGDELAVGVGDDEPDRGLAGVAPRSPVDVDSQLQALTSSASFASEITFWARWAGSSS